MFRLKRATRVGRNQLCSVLKMVDISKELALYRWRELNSRRSCDETKFDTSQSGRHAFTFSSSSCPEALVRCCS